MIEQAIILAAGLGTRLKPLTDHAPKCMTEVHGTPILLNALRNLRENGIERCTIAVGYMSQAVKSAVGNEFEGLKISYVYNRIYYKTNDMYSLWLARSALERGALVLEGDVFFRSETLRRAISAMGERSYYLAGKYMGKENEVWIETNESMRVRSIVSFKNESGPIGAHTYLSSGMLAVQPEYGRLFSRWLTEFVDSGRVNLLFDDILGEHALEEELYIFKIEDSDWVEIDTREDLERAEAVFKIPLSIL